MTRLPRAAEIVEFHDYCLAAPGAPARFQAGLWASIEADHWHNTMLWEQAELARRQGAPDSDIASNKRAIDSHERKKIEAIASMDAIFLEFLSATRPKAGARLSSETAGAMVDRLSLLALHIHAMRGEAQRADADTRQIAKKLERLQEQRSDLAGCLDRLLAESQRGESYFKVYPAD
ncbi:MAG TPA: DUF4254 domain-containing protein [Burkholderiales bacterium]